MLKISGFRKGFSPSGVMQGRDTKPGAKGTNKTVLRKFPRKSIDYHEEKEVMLYEMEKI